MSCQHALLALIKDFFFLLTVPLYREFWMLGCRCGSGFSSQLLECSCWVQYVDV